VGRDAYMKPFFLAGTVALFLTLSWTARCALADDAPVVAKDSVQVVPAHISGSEDAPKEKQMQWKPQISFRINGAIPGGSQCVATFGYPGHADWVKINCKPEEDGENSYKVEEATAGEKFTTDYVGPVDFSIKMHNELAGKDETLFAGKAKIAKFFGPAGPQYPEFYTDEDWRIPIGYLFYEMDPGHRDSFLNVEFWYRGNPASIEAHLFYKGKDIAKSTKAGNEGSDFKPQKIQWCNAKCEFLGVYEKDPGDDGYQPRFGISKNPGDYEIKALIAGKLARSIKFTVKPDGSFDNGIAQANKLGSKRAIVAVQVLGDAGPWDQQAWKAGAFYGNPLSGFTAPPATK